MHPAGSEPAIPASERPQTHAFDGAATGIGGKVKYLEYPEKTSPSVHEKLYMDCYGKSQIPGVPGEKPVPVFTKNCTWTAMGQNPGLHDERPATDHCLGT